MTAPPPKASIQEADILPETHANWFEILTFGWITSLLALGYARPLEAPDLYKLQDNRGAAFIGEKITASFEKRRLAAAEYNRRLLNGDVRPGMKALWWSLRGNRPERERKWREKDGQRKASLVFAMNDSVKWWFWSSGILKVLGDTAQVTSPLLVKVCCFSVAPILLIPHSAGHHQICHRFLHRPSDGRLFLHPTNWQRYRFDLWFAGIAGCFIAVYAPLLLSVCVHRRSHTRWSDQRDLCSVPSTNLSRAIEAHERFDNEPHLDGRVANRFLCRIFPYGMV